MIADLVPPTAESWDRFCLADPTATFFQTPSWLRVCLAMGAGWRDASLEVAFRDGARVLVPRLSRPAARGLFRQYESVPPGVYGAPLADSLDLSPRHWLAIGRLFRGFRVSNAAVVEPPGREIHLGAHREVGHSHLLRLSPGETEDDLFRRYRKGHRSAVLSARRGRLAAELATREEDFAAYHAMYLETAERWERRPHLIYPPEVFLVLCELARGTQGVRLWLVRRDGDLLAGALVLRQGRKAAYWHGASTGPGREANAGQLAVHSAILDASGRGADVFDLMPSAGLKGVEGFKAGFGAEEVPFGIHRFPESRSYALLRGLLPRSRKVA